jgi:two-component system sensor histidine kinase/response regulator
LKRVVGNRKLFLTLLKKYVSGQADAIDRIRSSLQSGDHASAERDAHTLKGVSGNIGAAKVEEVAMRIETSIRGGAAIDAVENDLLLCQGELDGLIASICTALNMEPPKVERLAVAPVATSEASTPEAAASGLTALMPKINQLMELMGEGDVGAVDLFEELQPVLEKELGAAVIKGIAKALDDFDFELAQEILRNATNKT